MPRPARHLYLAGRITKRPGHLQRIFRQLYFILLLALAYSIPAHAAPDGAGRLYLEARGQVLQQCTPCTRLSQCHALSELN